MFLAAFLAPALAADVQIEGFYRVRMRGFDTLSLDRQNALDEGLALYGQHRLWLRPRLLVSDGVSLFTEIRGLDGVKVGEEPQPYQTFDLAGVGVGGVPVVENQDLGSPTSTTDATDTLRDFTLWRAWGQVKAGPGLFSFGRMPLQWGRGIWLNDGVSGDLEYVDHGDTSDRVQYEALVEDSVFVRVGVDVPAERLVNAEDDTTALDTAFAYKTEDLHAGVIARLDHTGRRSQSVGSSNVFTVDISGDATLGRLSLGLEATGQFGGGDFESGVNDATITTFGGVFDATLALDAFTANVVAGAASGDGQPNDTNLKTFTFDRDYSVGMFLFEQPMPVLAQLEAAANEENEGRDHSEVRTGSALQNAMFLRPTLSKELVRGFTLSATWLGARMAKAPLLAGQKQTRGYGNEFQLGARFHAVEHFDATLRLGAFLPGSVYSVDQTDVNQVTGFDDAAFGGQLGLRVTF